MAYVKHTWVTDEVITAVNLNNIENGLEAISQSGTDRQVLGYVNSEPIAVTLGVTHLTDIGGFPSFANGVLTATAMNSGTQTGLLSFMEFSTTTAKVGTFPTYGTAGVLVVGTATANNHAVTKSQLDAKPSIGTTASTAKAGNYTPSATEIVTTINAMTPEQVTAVQTKLGITP